MRGRATIYRTKKDQEFYDQLERDVVRGRAAQRRTEAWKVRHQDEVARKAAGLCLCVCHLPAAALDILMGGPGYACFCSCPDRYKKGPHGKVKVAKKANQLR